MQKTEQSSVERIFSSILGAMSKILIKNNIHLPHAIEILKRALVKAALTDADATDSLISLKTGVHRKDVKRLRIELDTGIAAKSPIRGIAVVLATWSNDAPFCDSKGQRRILLRKGQRGKPGFDELVKASKVDLAAATVLQELQAQSLVSIHPDGGIELLSSTYVAQSGEAALEAFEATVVDHVRIAANNVLSPPGAPRHFDQVLRYSHLSAASVQALEDEARKLSRAYLETLNTMAHRLQSEDDASGTLSNGRFVAGAFIAPVLPDQASVAKDKTLGTEDDQNQ